MADLDPVGKFLEAALEDHLLELKLQERQTPSQNASPSRAVILQGSGDFAGG